VRVAVEVITGARRRAVVYVGLEKTPEAILGKGAIGSGLVVLI
jgi:hypothetical protein